VAASGPLSAFQALLGPRQWALRTRKRADGGTAAERTGRSKRGSRMTRPSGRCWTRPCRGEGAARLQDGAQPLGPPPGPV